MAIVTFDPTPDLQGGASERPASLHMLCQKEGLCYEYNGSTLTAKVHADKHYSRQHIESAMSGDFLLIYKTVARGVDSIAAIGLL